MTEYWLGAEQPAINWLMISSRISASVRSKTARMSVRLMIPTRRPSCAITGRRLILRSYMSLAACSTVSSGPIVTAGLVIRSAAVTPPALAREARCTRPASSPATPPGSPSTASLTIRSASETTPVTLPCASRTGNALTRHSRSLPAISRNDAVSPTHTGSVDMTSSTVFILITLPLVPYAPSIVRSRPERQGRWSARAGPKVAPSGRGRDGVGPGEVTAEPVGGQADHLAEGSLVEVEDHRVRAAHDEQGGRLDQGQPPAHQVRTTAAPTGVPRPHDQRTASRTLLRDQRRLAAGSAAPSGSTSWLRSRGKHIE